MQNGQVPAPLSFTDAATSADQQPVTWYDTITNGNIEHLMPPWGDSLSDAERWDVGMYTYMLPYSQDQIAHGHDLYDADCSGCDTSALTDLATMATLSQNALIEHLGAMPAFAGLSDADKNDLAAYVRTLSFANPGVVAATAQAERTVEPPVSTAEVGATSGTVDGKVTNGTASGSVPDNLTLTLFIFDANLNQQQMTTSENADGSYSFADVPLDPSNTYVVTTNYRNRVFASDLLTGDKLSADASDGTVDLPVTIYELTEDADVIKIDGLVTQISIIGDSMQIAQVFNFTNTSDRAFTSSETASNGEPISVVITLPPGAVVAGFPDNQNRYVVDQDKFTVFDTVPVLPGEQHIVQLVYLIPYDQGAIIEQPMNYTLNGPVRLLINPPTLTTTSEQLPSLGQQTVGNTEYAIYGAPLSLAAGDVLRYTVSGEGISATENAARNEPVVSSNSLLLVVVGVLVIAGLLGGGLFLIARRNRSGDQQVIDILVRQIAELDADHDAGKIDDDAYEQQRSALKARLASLMERKKTSEK